MINRSRTKIRIQILETTNAKSGLDEDNYCILQTRTMYKLFLNHMALNLISFIAGNVINCIIFYILICKKVMIISSLVSSTTHAVCLSDFLHEK